MKPCHRRRYRETGKGLAFVVGLAAATPVPAAVSDTGARVTMGTDWVVLPEPNLFPALSGVVDRGTESLSLAEAIRTITINGARSIGRQDEIGSIVTGKVADMVVLDRNLFEISSAEVADTQVLTTIFEGRVVYQADR